jgi:hypothetical protein
MTDAQRELIVKLGGLDTFHNLVMGVVATLFQGEQTRADAAYAASDAALYPVDISTVTPQTTFRKNAVIGIGGVLYRAKRATASMPLTMVVSDGRFVTHEVNGQIAFVVQNMTVNTDWDVWMDAGMAYAYSLADKRITTLEQALPAVRTTADSALQPTTTYSANGQQYTADELLKAMAELMTKTIVTL